MIWSGLLYCIYDCKDRLQTCVHISIQSLSCKIKNKDQLWSRILSISGRLGRNFLSWKLVKGPSQKDPLKGMDHHFGAHGEISWYPATAIDKHISWMCSQILKTETLPERDICSQLLEHTSLPMGISCDWKSCMRLKSQPA